MRRLWSLFASIRNSGGVIRNGVLAVSGVDWTSPSSIQASTSAGWAAVFDNRTVTSPWSAGNTTRVPPITTLAPAPGTYRQSATSAAQAAAMTCLMDDAPCAASDAKESFAAPPRYKPRRSMACGLLVDHRELDIGRASCRERGEDGGGGRTMK